MCQLEDGNALIDSSECVYGVDIESRGKLKIMGLGPVIDMKGLGERK